MVRKPYDQYVCLPETEAEWGVEVKGFLENYKLPCVVFVVSLYLKSNTYLRIRKSNI